MKKLLAGLVVLAMSAVALASTTKAVGPARPAATAAQATTVITLNKRNTLVLRNVIMSDTITKVQQQANKVSQGLSKDEQIYLFLDTPGGSIEAGEQLITTLQGLPQKVNTITSFAASMGFITAQSLNARYILPNGILMSHRARGGAEGQIPGELNTRVNFFTGMLDDKDAQIAARVGMNKEDYQKMILNEYWIAGQRAVTAKMADAVVLVRCDKELTEGKSTEVIQTFFGAVRVTYSDCPLVTAPLEVDFEGLILNSYDSNDKASIIAVRKVVLELVYNKKSFYYDYILTNKYKSVLP